MDKKLIFLDCDPGTDDAFALLLACADPTAEVIGVSAVGGNVPLEHTLKNALDLVAFAGRPDIPVFAGAAHPMVGEGITAEEFHGADGLAGIPLPPSGKAPEAEPAWDAIHRLAKAHPGEMVLVLTGPCTNAAIALTKWPDLPKLVKEIVIMGGAASFGNSTPAAEFNFQVDPEAAEAVFQCGANISVCPLDVTYKSYLTARELAQLEAQGTPQARFAAQVMAATIPMCEKPYGVPGAIMHDPCAMMYALRPELFTAKTCWCAVEVEGKLCRGKLVTDAFCDASESANSNIVYDVDRPAFVQAMLDTFAHYREG